MRLRVAPDPVRRLEERLRREYHAKLQADRARQAAMRKAQDELLRRSRARYAKAAQP